jgi:PAS domain-containing protein
MGCFEDSLAAVWMVCTATKTVEEVNPAALNFSGFSHSESVGKSLEELFTEDGADAILRHCAAPADYCVDTYSAGIVPLVTKDRIRRDVRLFCKLSRGPEPRLLLLAREVYGR